ncbi:hypothetical protein [Priestia megaterium]|uniref:hypothetical protein n=1 Tax=Priestia megaterium TaxID=1404 RepID=UPI00159BDCFF|nr:hypothetical protein [Priestia megaterium]
MKTIKKIVALAAVASLAFGFGAGIKPDTPKTTNDTNQTAAIKIQRDPSGI